MSGRHAGSKEEVLVRRYWESYDPYRARELGRLRHADWQLEWPQSGERIRSHEDDVAIHQSYPGYPHISLQKVEGGYQEDWVLSPLAPVRVLGNAGLWVTENLLEYPSGERYHEISILELDRNRVVRQTDYFAELFSPPEWREPWVERIDEKQAVSGWQIRASAEDESAHRAALEGYVRRFGAGERAEAVKDLMHVDAIVEWPQSGERIIGLANYIEIVERHPTPPNASLRRIVGSGDFFVLELLLDYEGTPFHEVACLHFEGKQVRHLTAYFAAPFDPPEWRR